MITSAELRITPQQNAIGEKWLGLLFGDLLLSNSIENADWKSDPVCPWACPDCGIAWCAQVGLSRIVRTDSQLLWMPPYYQSDGCDPSVEDQSHSLLEDAVLIDMTEWERVRAVAKALPAIAKFPIITNHDLYNLWLQQRPEFAVETEYDTFSQHIRRKCLASHPLDIDIALAVIETWDSAMLEPAIPLLGSLQAVPAVPNTEVYNTLYFDMEGTPEFVTFRTCDSRLLIAGEYILQ